MKKSILSALVVALGIITINAAVTPSDFRIYINPGHGSWTTIDRPFGTVNHPDYKVNGEIDTLRFFESNTNLEKCFGVMEKLIDYGVPFDRTRNQTNSNPARLGAALDLTQNIVFSRVKTGPWPMTGVANDYNQYNRPLSEIAVEVEQNNFDMFLSVHSNGMGEGTNENYLLYIYRGATGFPEVRNSDAMAAASWPYAIANPHQMWTARATNPYIVGDWSFYGSHDVSTNGCDGYLGVLKHHTPGFLVEGYFHTYQPGRHRAMNWDVDRMEGVCYARGIADYYGFTKESTGDIYGIVRDQEEHFTHNLYKPNEATLDYFKPINGAKVILKKGGVKIAEYITDDNYNGAFVFADLQPGEYTLQFEAEGYNPLEQELVVKVEAGKTSYPTPQLKNPSYVPPVVLPSEMAAYAYDLSVETVGETAVFKFKSTKAVASGALVFTDANGNTVTSIPLDNIVAGQNTATVQTDILPEEDMHWGVAINNNVNENAGLVKTIDAGFTVDRGGVAIVRDPEDRWFGYTFNCHSYAKGICVYDPAFNLTGTYAAGSPFQTGNGVSPLRNTYNSGKLYLSDWSDATSGVYVWDPSNPNAPVKFLFEGSERDNLGCLRYNGTVVGGSISHVVFTGTGADRVMWTFPEDWPDDTATSDHHMMRGYKIGTSDVITTAPELSLPKNNLGNANQYYIATERGLWAGQYRAGTNSEAYPGFIFMDWNGTKRFSAHVLPEISWSNAVIALSDDESLLATSRGTSPIAIFNVTWNGNTPTLEFAYEIPDSKGIEGNDGYTGMQFDQAGNLVAFCRKAGLRVFGIKDNPAVVTTPAPSSQIVRGTTGIAGISVDTDDAPEYLYDLSGRLIEGIPTPGVYIKVKGTKIQKTIIQ